MDNYSCVYMHVIVTAVIMQCSSGCKWFQKYGINVFKNLCSEEVTKTKPRKLPE